MISTDSADKACHVNFLLYRVHSMVEWYVVQCFQSAVSAIWTNRMKAEKAWEEKDRLAAGNLREHWVPLTEHRAVGALLCNPGRWQSVGWRCVVQPL